MSDSRRLDAPAAAGYDRFVNRIARHKMSYADLEKIPADRNRHEILAGEWIMTPAPGLEHQRIVGRLYRVLADHAEKHNLGEVFVAPADVILSRHDVVEPDVLFVSAARSSSLKKKFVQGAPDLVVEVSSPSTAALDRGRKLEAYRKRGVGEYWIVDLFARVVEVHEFGRRPRTRIHQEGQTLTSDRLPGLSVDVSALFRK